MLNITFMPKMPSPRTCHMILALIAWLILAATWGLLAAAWILFEHKHYEVSRILGILAAISNVAPLIIGARGMLSTFTCTATATTSNETSKVTTDKPTDETTSEVTRTAPSTAISDQSLIWYTSLVFLSLSCLANALAMWLFTYSPEVLDDGLHRVIGFLLVLSIVLAAVVCVMGIMDHVRDFRVKWKQMKRTERKDKGVQTV